MVKATRVTNVRAPMVLDEPLAISRTTGEHVVHFARNFPSLVFQPSDRRLAITLADSFG